MIFSKKLIAWLDKTYFVSSFAAAININFHILLNEINIAAQRNYYLAAKICFKTSFEAQLNKIEILLQNTFRSAQMIRNIAKQLSRRNISHIFGISRSFL